MLDNQTMKYIVRIDCKNTHGWQVRVCYKSQSITHSKMFSDKKCGSYEKALKAAKRYRKKLLADLGISDWLKLPKNKPGPKERFATNSSGIIGVSLTNNDRPSGITSSWTAHYMREKKQCHKAYAILKYGEINAFKWACLFRYMRHGELKVYRGHKFPARIPVPWKYID